MQEEQDKVTCNNKNKMENTLIIDPYKKTCAYCVCAKAFTAKRLNQDYCTPECKKKTNNGKARAFAKTIKSIIVQHRLNHEILEHYYSQGKFEVSLAELERNGFNYSKPTGLRMDINNTLRIPEFYNYSLETTSPQQFKITKLW